MSSRDVLPDRVTLVAIHTGFEELIIPFTIWGDVEPQEDSGLYFMLCNAYIADIGFYFGLQTNVQDGTPPYGWLGKAVIYSRWGTRDLAHVRTDGFTQSSGHEGDFIGVRLLYEWEPGDYVARFAPDGEDLEGRWFGLWITNLDEDAETTWIGSLRFPDVGGVDALLYSTVEIYGGPIRPIDIPVWHVSMEPPVGDGKPALMGVTEYSVFSVGVLNADSYYMDGEMHIHVGGATERTGESRHIDFGE